MTSAIATGATPAITALLQQLSEGRDTDAAAREILRITAGLEAQLRQRDADVTAAIKELESFSYSVSHDLRAPLSTIDGFSRLLEGSSAKGDAERSKHYLQRLRLGVANINELIAALLLVSRLLRAPMAPQAVDLSALAQAALTGLQAAEPGRLAQVDVQAGLVARGDPALLKQLMEHLRATPGSSVPKRTPRSSLSAARPARTAKRFILCGTRAPVSTWRMPTNCSASSSACTSAPTSPAWAPAWRWRSASWRATGEGFGPRRRLIRAQRSTSRCPGPDFPLRRRGAYSLHHARPRFASDTSFNSPRAQAAAAAF
jgi:hypothetical protein